MIPIKIQCGCGQRYSFDVEPVGGQMGYAVACPVCGVDGTAAANELIGRALAVAAPAVAPAAPPPQPALGIRLKPAEPTEAPSLIVPPSIAPAERVPRAAASGSGAGGNLGMGVLGALLGSGVGAGVMFAFYQFAHFRFPLLGVGIGYLTALGARWLFKGGDSKLGIISGAAALLSVVGSLFLMYGDFPMINVISAVVSVSVAYRVAAK